VAGFESLAGKRRRHIRADSSSPSDLACRRRNEQRWVRWGINLQGLQVLHAGVPDEGGTERALHKRVRVLRNVEHAAGLIASGDSKQEAVAFSPRGSGARQPHVREIRDGGGVSVNKDVRKRRGLLRLEGAARAASEFSMARGPTERTGGPAFAPNQQPCGLAAPPLAFSPSHARVSAACGRGSVRVVPKLPTPELLRFPPRSSGGGGGRLQFQVDRTPVPVRLSPSNISFEGAAEDNLGAPSHHGVARPDMDGTDVVADPHVHDAGPADPFSERGVDNTGPDGQSNLAVPVASSRIRFIRRFAAGDAHGRAPLFRPVITFLPSRHRSKVDRFINRRGIIGLVGFAVPTSPIRAPLDRFRVGLMAEIPARENFKNTKTSKTS
jgi:hypothetical protein